MYIPILHLSLIIVTTIVTVTIIWTGPIFSGSPSAHAELCCLFAHRDEAQYTYSFGLCTDYLSAIELILNYCSLFLNIYKWLGPNLTYL